jgi:uncharacterized protein YlxW (UPF0749 family)
MTETTDSRETPATPDPSGAAADRESARRGRNRGLGWASVLACIALGFLLVAQFQATENLGERLDIEREEDLAQILADLSAQSDRLQDEITSLRLTLLAFENSAETEELAVRSLRRRLNELRILAGTVPVEGQGVRMTVEDPQRQVTQELMVDTVQELRDAGAEAIAINDTRLIASSAFTTRNERLLLDGGPLEPPIVITAIGPSDTISKALAIPGGAIDSLQSRPEVTTRVESLEELAVPARPDSAPFVFGEPIPPQPAQ